MQGSQQRHSGSGVYALVVSHQHTFVCNKKVKPWASTFGVCRERDRETDRQAEILREVSNGFNSPPHVSSGKKSFP